MMLNALAYNSLCSEEVRIIESMRRFSKVNGNICLNPHHDQNIDLIDKPMHKFLLILWKHDSSALDLCKQNDTIVSIFELQLLYCIAKCQRGHNKTVNNLLSWWLPVCAEKSSYALINSMAETLNNIGIVCVAEDRLLAKILTLIPKNKDKPVLYVIEGGKSLSNFNFEKVSKANEK